MRAGAPIEAIAFDLDGTLVDSAGGVAHALNAALYAHAMAPFPLDRIRSWIGDGPDALIRRALQATNCPESEHNDLSLQLRSAFDVATLASPMVDSFVFDGIAEMLATVGERRPLVVVTNKPTALARAVLKQAGLIDRFAHVLGADEAAQRKPSAHLLRAASERLGVPTAALLMVGDAPPDAGAAKAAGCPMAWAGWGYGQAPPNEAWRLEAPAHLALCLQRHPPLQPAMARHET